MMTSLQTPTPTIGKLKQRVRPGLKLNTAPQSASAEEEKPIVITMNSSESYVIQNHPRYTDQSEFSYSTQKKYNQIFFSHETLPEAAGDCSYEGDAFYVVQKANGKEMQDKFKVKNPMQMDDLTFFGVYDGHTTHLIAELLAQKLDEYICENLKGNNVGVDTALKQAFRRIETDVIRNLEQQRPRGGSTALCTILRDKKLYSANLGDSQAIIIRGKNVVKLTNLHDFSNETERFNVEQKGGTILRNRLEGELAISRSIGDINYKAYMSSEPELSTYEVTEDDDFLLLGSDGFFNGLNPEQCKDKIEEFKRNEKFSTGLKGLGDFLVDEAKSNIKTKKDNMTLIVMDLREHFHKRSCKKNAGFTGFF